ncbi:hypothetical protein BGX33_011709 [Mortierella sp. NVP41]|nr:hypothetical protein BGX33_011709 [Mortierella sp. NVP41]
MPQGQLAERSVALFKRYYCPPPPPPPPPKQHFYQNRILDPYASQAVNPITLRQLVFFGRNMLPDKLLKSANYVRTELPIRLAHRIRDFQNLPFIVGTNPHIERVYDLYWQAFEQLRTVPEIKTLKENDRFCELIKDLLNDHLVVIPQLALGIMESAKHIPPDQVDQFMNKMLRSRISRRVLAEQHISLTANYNSPNHTMTDRGYIGIIYTHCNPREIVERTALLAAETCRRQLEHEQGYHGHHDHHGNHSNRGSGNSRDGIIKPPQVVLDGNIDAEFSYIPDHIEYILYELLKNSMRSVMLHGIPDSTTGELPPIQITVCEGTNDIVFRISDRGGGISPLMEPDIWSYSQSAARFVNFQRIAKMAATVQEQMVSPRRSVSAAESSDDVGASEAGSEIGSGSGSGATDFELPPAPAFHKTPSDDTATIILDRHSQTRMEQNRLNNSNSKSTTTGSQPGESPSTSESLFSTTSSTTPFKSVIDPSQASESAKETGHLDRDTCHETESQQQQSMHLGIGLPMSRVYAEYWGGDLKVFTMHGYGTDAYARLCKFGNIYENFDV